jgi:two-component system nitrate/nitrite response regulator NarL
VRRVTASITVVAADDHPVFLDGLVHVLRTRPELRLVGTATDGRKALQLVRDLVPDAIVLDLDLPALDGAAVLAALADEHLPTRAVVVSAYEDSATIYRTFAGGAKAYLTKSSSARAICEAISAVVRGETVIPRALQAGLASEVRLRRDAGDGPTLSPRELDIVRLAAEGRSTAEIAHELNLSPATIKSHVQHAFEKLGVSDRAAAVAKAMRAGLLH